MDDNKGKQLMKELGTKGELEFMKLDLTNVEEHEKVIKSIVLSRVL
ncbi:MAG: hypothetical protein ACP5D6_04465 [Kosmotogaceae bacterium]